MFASLYVPDFLVQAALLSQVSEAREALRKSPIAILDGPANLPKVVALNDSARNRGIEVSMTKLQVETYGGVLLRKRSTADEELANARLIECANAFSPIVESAGVGIVLLDLEGTGKLFGAPTHTAQQILVTARENEFHLHVPVASNPAAALYAAHVCIGITLIPDGQEARCLARLKVDL